MKLINEIKKWLTFWITAWFTMLVIWVSYAAFTTITQVAPSDTLTASTFNTIITNQEDLKARLDWIDPKQLAKAWVNFDSAWNIRDSYNVSSVSHDGVWLYTLNFTNPINKNNSAISIVTDWWTTTWWVWFINNTSYTSNYADWDNSKLSINIRRNDNNDYLDNRWFISILVFWW